MDRLKQHPDARPQAGDLSDLLTRASVLVIDDEPGMRNFLTKTLAPYCRDVADAESVVAAEVLMRTRHFDVVILDNKMPGRSGIDWLAEQRAQGTLSDTIMITAYADLETAILAMRAGAADFILKPFRSGQVLNAVRRCVEFSRLRRENTLLRHELGTSDIWRRRRHELIGASPAITDVRKMLARVAPLATSILISGESGTGKEVAARQLHRASDRAGGPFVEINCATIPANLLEIELFGHTPGAFAGADTGREGLLVSAEGGTVFLDEIADLSLEAQKALLRVLEDRRVRPLGSTRDVPLDLRFIFATKKDLAAETAAGRFREDLFFRVNVLEVRMPPLRHRDGDVLELAQIFMAEIAGDKLGDTLPFDSAFRTAVLRHRWPGNIRELLNFMERALILGRFPLEMLAPEPHIPLETLEMVEKRQILLALEVSRGNRSNAARRLGISRKTIERKCSAWGI